MVQITHSSFIWRYFYLLLAILIVTSALLILFALDVYKRRFKSNVQPIVPIVPGVGFGRSGISRIPEDRTNGRTGPEEEKEPARVKIDSNIESENQIQKHLKETEFYFVRRCLTIIT